MMTLTNRSFVSYLALLIVITIGVRCSSRRQNFESSQKKKVCQEKQSGCQVLYGRGVESYYRPQVVKCLTNWRQSSKITIYSKDNNSSCSYDFIEKVQVKDVYQVSATDVLLFFQFKLAEKSILSVDMKSCWQTTISQNLDEFSKRQWDRNNLLLYTDTFDAIVTKNDVKVRVSYDLIRGNQIGHTKRFPLSDRQLLLSTRLVSPKSRYSNIIIEYVEEDKRFVSILDADGQHIRKLKEQPQSQIQALSKIDVSDSLSAYCYETNSRFECVQVDEFAKEKFRNSVNAYPEDQISTVRNLKDGGVVLFTASHRGIHVAEMRPDKTSTMRHIGLIVHPLDADFLIDFNEHERHYTIQTYLHPDLCQFTFPFPSTIA